MIRDIERVLFTREEIEKKVKFLAKKIESEYADKNPLILCILKGSFLFVADLVRELDFPCTIEFIRASSYGSSTTSGELSVKFDTDFQIKGRHIIVAEDILDTGTTLSCIMKMIEGKMPESLKLCTLLDKPDRRKISVNADYVGFQIPNEFVVGYGLDYDEKYRNLPYIGVLKREIYSD